MKKRTFPLFLITFIFLACNKMDTKRSITSTNALGKAINAKGNIMTMDCGPTPTVNVDAFSSVNKVADAVLSPATGGTDQQNAQNNYERIQWCLTKYKHVSLNSGIFPINNLLWMDGATMVSANGDWPMIKATANTSNSMIAMVSNSRIGFVTLNANKQFMSDPNASVVEILGSNNQIDNSYVECAESPLLMTDINDVDDSTRFWDMAGVYIQCGDNNVVMNNQIRYNGYGVIAKSSIVSATNNVIKNNDMYYNRCDAVSLPGYAQVLNNIIRLNGWDCHNGGIGKPGVPGAGIYSEGNSYGALIQGNTIYDNNGHNIDMVKGCHFTILDNHVYDPGNKSFPLTDYGIAPDYGGAFCISLYSISNSTIEGNDVRNEGRPENGVGNGFYGNDPNHIFSANGSVAMSDLPFFGNSVIAFCLSQSPGATALSIHNTIRNNIFIATPNGIGYFSSRNTGFYGNQGWDSQSTNYYTLNNPFGSNVGSVRCGGNWYAANGVDVNTDDYQHQPPGSSWTGSDNRNFY